MKNIALILLLCAGTHCVTAQVNSLAEDFNVSCPSFSAFPSDWFKYNTVPATAMQGAWACAPLNGRNNGPGMDCTGYYNGVLNFDTSFLISPELDLSPYAGQHVYLHFDSKTSKLNLGSKMSVLLSTNTDSSHTPSAETFSTYIDLTTGMSPVFGNEDSSGWVTHEVDMTDFETAGLFYIAFRYTSTDTSGSIWFLDNINTTTAGLSVPVTGKYTLPLKVLGGSTASAVTISYTAPESGLYHLAIIDMLGREVYKEIKNTESGSANYTINNLDLHQGMYLIKMGNGSSNSTAKVVIP